jgi:acyl-CoA reductase-like NAD-dependent aldehyde dehydrogenase
VSQASRARAAPAGSHEVVSPVTGQSVGTVALWDAPGIHRRLALAETASPPLRRREVMAFLRRLEADLRSNRERLLEVTVLETGFILDHAREIVDGAIEFLGDFERHAREGAAPELRVPHSYSGQSRRNMTITHRPYRRVAAMVPQNASFTLAVTIIASALFAGARVLIRPSLQCGVSGELLAEMVERSDPPEGTVLILNSLAREFLAACHAADEIELIHYIGSNRHALTVFVEAFAAKKVCLLDGQGNGMLYVDAGFPIERAVEIIASGATRYNGETCTSVNGVLVEQSRYHSLRDGLADAFTALRVGDPTREETQIGPLFSRPQAEELITALRAGGPHRVLCGGTAFGAYVTPTIVEGVTPADPLVREGVFGPALWIQSVRADERPAWLRANTFPLSDTILTRQPRGARAFAMESRAARICVNADPSIESMFEPWGGYPPSGLNPVSIWIDKYRRCYQLDAPVARPTSRSAREPRA